MKLRALIKTPKKIEVVNKTTSSKKPIENAIKQEKSGNKLPPDTYNNKSYNISDSSIEVSNDTRVTFYTTRGGEYGLPEIGIKIFKKGGSDWVETRKGFTVPLDKVEEVINVLDKFYDDCHSNGLMKEYEEV